MDGNQTHVHVIPTKGVTLQTAGPVLVTKAEYTLLVLCSVNTQVSENRSQPLGRCVRET